jgi:hypothetical protein
MDVSEVCQQVQTISEKLEGWKENIALIVPSIYEAYNLYKKIEEENKVRADQCHAYEIHNRACGFFDAADFWRINAEVYENHTTHLTVERWFWLYIIECNEKTHRFYGLFDAADYYRQLKEYMENGIHFEPLEVDQKK